MSVQISISMPIGAWHPLLPRALASLKDCGASVELAFLDASNDARVATALAESGIAPAYHRTGPDAGQSAAIQEGWDHTSGELVGWLNADDIVFPGAFKRIVEAFKTDPAAAVVFGDSTIIGEDYETLGIHGQVRDIDDQLLRSNCVSQPSALVQRAAMSAIGGVDPKLRYTMDWDFWIRLHQQGYHFARIPDFVSAVYWGAGTKTSELSYRRLHEVYRVSARSAGRVAGMKTVIAMLRQAMGLAAPSRGRVSGGNGVFIAADGNPNETGAASVCLPVINAGEQTTSELLLFWTGALSAVEIRSAAATPRILEIATTQTEARAEVKLAPGQVVLVTLVAETGKAAHLVSARPS